jgi:hypothetical protein
MWRSHRLRKSVLTGLAGEEMVLILVSAVLRFKNPKEKREMGKKKVERGETSEASQPRNRRACETLDAKLRK